MDKNTLAVLKVINQNSKDGQAIIFEKEDLLQGVENPQDVNLAEIIKELTLTELIKLKYQDQNTFCLVTLPKGKLVSDSQQVNKKGVVSSAVDPIAVNFNIDYKKIAKISFKNGFLGSLLAGTIVLAIAFVLYIFL